MHRCVMENVRKIGIKLENIWIDLIRGIYTPYILPPFMIHTSRECIRFGWMMTRTIDQFKVKTGKVEWPGCLTAIKVLCSVKVGEVLMVIEDLNFVFGSLQYVAPFFQSLNDRVTPCHRWCSCAQHLKGFLKQSLLVSISHHHKAGIKPPLLHMLRHQSQEENTWFGQEA